MVNIIHNIRQANLELRVEQDDCSIVPYVNAKLVIQEFNFPLYCYSEDKYYEFDSYGCEIV
jgi:hypothetical protein